MKKNNVITLGVAVVDIIAYPADKSLFDRDNTPIDEVALAPGGDAVNQAINLARLGDSASLCCRLGDDTLGRFLAGEVSSAGVNTKLVAIAPKSTTSAAIVLVSNTGDRNIICKKGNNYDFCIEDFDMDAIADTKALSINSLFGIPKLEANGLREILEHAKQNAVVTFADMGSDKMNKRLQGVIPFLPLIDFFMPSEAESLHLTGEPNPVKAATIFKEAGASNIIIKLGHRGVFANCKKFSGFVAPFQVTPVDTTGAGDSFCSGLIHKIISGNDVESAIAFANACGAFTTQYFGATSTNFTKINIEAFITSTRKNFIY